MKSLLVVAFIGCTCAFAYGQQPETQKEAQPSQNTEEIASTPIPEPLFVISRGGIKKEISTDEMGKLSITQIASVELLLDSDSVKEYGEKGKNGVMIICLKED
jgi:hypothetical protein